jgi:hypothetical protein
MTWLAGLVVPSTLLDHSILELKEMKGNLCESYECF